MPKSTPRTLNTTFGALAFYGATSAVLSWVLLDQLGILWLVPKLRGREWIVAPVALVGALLGVTKLNRLIHGLAGLVLGLWLAVVFTPVSGALARPLKIESAPAKADAVVVLSSRVQPDGDLTTHAETRLLRGLELVEAKYAPRLILTELPPPGPSYRDAAREMAKRLGITAEIESVGPVGDTHDEAVAVAALAKEKGWKRILLVTSPTHSQRAAGTFRKAGLEVISTPSRETGYDLEKPVQPGDRLRAFTDALRERVGIQVYRSRGWL
jgi:uncharacterized SAM-binding protein YcdF (DUF218 family)